MTDERPTMKPREDAGKATVEDGMVILDGPDGVAVTMTADAAYRTADSLHAAAMRARLHLMDPAERKSQWKALHEDWRLAEQAARRVHASNTLRFQECAAGKGKAPTAPELEEATRLQSVADDIRMLADAFLETAFGSGTV